ncbi:DUF2975 domain-containing protein [Saccharopolyspora pogona]|uniref:DUF2975 domain-containing protein n=1 Tax=Saccharopolyspora pogona TaxID=333966 RepID=UPI0016861E8A|nr:DUF2975 domain-containing protein [Saccharopolyspora pogona]
MGSTSRWARLDNHVLEAAIALAMLLVGLFGALFPILGVTGPLPPTDTREVQLNAPATLPGTAPAGPVALRGTHDAVLIFTDPSFADRLLLALPTLVGNLLLMAALSILLRVARTFRDGDFFVPENAPRLFAIAAIVTSSGLVVPLADMITTDLLVSGTEVAQSIRTVFEFEFPLFLGLLIAAAAMAFRNGIRLRTDTEGLV